MMKKLILLCSVMVLALGIAANATETRTMVMGWNDGIMVDDYNVMRFYGRTLNYPNIAVAEFCNFNRYYYETLDNGYDQQFYKLGVHWEFNEDNPWVLGTYISNEDPLIPMTFSGEDLTQSWFYGDTLQNRRIDIVYGRTISNMNFGFLFDYNRASFKGKDTLSDGTQSQLEQSAQYYRFGFGLTEALSGQWDVALTFGFGTWTEKDFYGETLSEPDGFYDLTLEGRYFMVKSPKLTFVPHAKVMLGKRGAKYPINDTLTYTESETLTSFELGWGMHYVTGPGLLAVLDLGFWYENLKYEASDGDLTMEEKYTSYMIPYIQVGVEGEVFKWMDVRFGAVSYWETDKYDYHYERQFVDNETYLGFGFHFGRLHLDTYANPDMFLNGFDFISGAGDTDMNFQISALYEMF